MVEWLRVLACLSEDQNSASRPNKGWLTGICNSTPKSANDLFWLPLAPAHTCHTLSKIHTYKCK